MSAVDRKGVVSLWGGQFDSEDEFFSYVEKEYPEGGATSGFIRDSGIGFYDEDFSEGNYFIDGNIDSAIRDLSYGDSFYQPATKAASHISGMNSIFAIYDVDASGLKSGAMSLAFLGVFSYRK